MNYRRFIYFLIGLMPISAWAQFIISPIQNSISNPHLSNARTQSLAPMKLPFWDDFSSPINSDTLWDTKATVWINNGLAINPPTVYVATFDGLNENGNPYSSNPTSLDFGLTDSLESRRIKMTDVSPLFRNTVFLSFYYQWEGNGEVPDQNDFLRLEFLNDLDTWETIVTLKAELSQLPDQFYSQTIRINQSRFFHDNFKFRFRSSGRKSGRYDTWHVDYIYMNQGRNENDLLQGFPDRAPFLSMTSLFGKYYAVPMSHFVTNITENTGLPSFGIHNLSSIPQPMNYSLDALVTHYTDGVPTTQAYTEIPDIPILPTIVGFEKREITFPAKPDLSAFVDVDSLFLTIQNTLVTGDSVNTGFEPIDFYSNDTTQQQYTLKDYYAYDDGTAEYAFGLTQSGNQAAYRFVMQTNTADTINGVYIHYPQTFGISATTVAVRIWANKNGEPGQLLLEELVPVQRKTNSEFVLRPFIQSIIVKDTFFIGWEQPSTGRVQIGLDTRQNNGDQLFVNVTGTWVVNTLIKGSAMIRPRFGTGDVITAVDEQVEKRVSIYPNPNKGVFTLSGECTILGIFTSTGTWVDYSTESSLNEKHIKLDEGLPGLYLIRYQVGKKIVTDKILVSEH